MNGKIIGIVSILALVLSMVNLAIILLPRTPEPQTTDQATEQATAKADTLEAEINTTLIQIGKSDEGVEDYPFNLKQAMYFFPSDSYRSVNNSQFLSDLQTFSSIEWASLQLPVFRTTDNSFFFRLIGEYTGFEYCTLSAGNYSQIQWEPPSSSTTNVTGEQVQLGSPYGWYNSGTTVNITVSCPSGNAFTITQVRVSNTTVPVTGVPNLGPVAPQSYITLIVTYSVGWKSGYSYTFVVVTANNNQFQTTGTCP